MIFKSKFFIHNIYAGDYLESFLLSATVSILLIRFYLNVFGYPQIGVLGFHIAHMLWGGLLMLGAIVILLAFFGRYIMRLSAILAGIGFGAFIDELGKFITRDNNYFFSPTISLIYVIFVVLFLVFRFLQRDRKYSQKEYLATAFDLVRDAVLAELDLGGRKKALILLDKCDSANPVVSNLKKILDETRVGNRPSTLDKLNRWGEKSYRSLLSRGWFLPLLIFLLLAYTGFNLYHSSGFVFAYLKTDVPGFSYIGFGQLSSAAAAAAVLLFGILKIFGSRIAGYHVIRDSVLISLLLTQFFDFYSNQSGAVVVLIINLAVFFILEFAIFQEHIAFSSTALEPE